MNAAGVDTAELRARSARALTAVEAVLFERGADEIDALRAREARIRTYLDEWRIGDESTEYKVSVLRAILDEGETTP